MEDNNVHLWKNTRPDFIGRAFLYPKGNFVEKMEAAGVIKLCLRERYVIITIRQSPKGDKENGSRYVEKLRGIFRFA